MTEHILLFILGLSFTLFGMNLMSKGLEHMTGGKLERALESATTTKSRFPIVGRIKGMLVGCGLTALVQSSSSTTVMTVGFVNSGMMRLEQAVGIIMGANIGTTITSWIFALTGIEGDAWYATIFKPTTFSPVLALIGIVMMLFFKRQKLREIGVTLVSFAVLMYGMTLMSDNCSVLVSGEWAQGFFATLENPLLGVLAGALFTGVIQASAAAIGIVQALALSGSITYGAAIPIILGMNIGTCVTALLSCIGANKNARRTAMVHLYFNILGSVLFLGLFYGANAIFQFPFMNEKLRPKHIALIHTIFNVSATLVFLPFGDLLAKLARLTIPDGKDERAVATTLLDDRFLKTPAFAVQQCVTVSDKMAALSHETLLRALDLLTHYDEKEARRIDEDEEHLDRYEDKLGTYLVKLGATDLDDASSRKVNQLLHVLSDFERIGDHAVNLKELAQEMKEKKLVFSEQGAHELDVLIAALREIMDLSFSAYREGDVTKASKVEPLEDVIDLLVKTLGDHHVARLQAGVCTIVQGFVYHDILANCERVSDHCSNIAVDLIEVSHAHFDTHRYMLDLKTGPSTAYADMVQTYSKKYELS